MKIEKINREEKVTIEDDASKAKSNKEKKEFKIDKKKLAIVGIAVVAILIIALISVLITNAATGKVANTISNIRNLGYSTVNGNSIYYIAPNQDSTKIGIYKANKNGQDIKELYMSEDNLMSLNVKGDYIYFISVGKRALNDQDDSDNKICRIKKDGSNFQVINDNDFNNACFEVYVVKNHLYYVGVDQNIYKMDLDGKNRKQVYDNGTGFLAVTNKYILFNHDEDGNANNYVTYIMGLNGENPRPVLDGTRIYSVDINGDYIYYANTDKAICRTKIDSKQEEKLYDLTAYSLNLSGDYLYYLNYENYNEGKYDICIFKVKKDGSTETPQMLKKLDSSSEFINVVNDWVLYMDFNEESGFINLVKTDGSKEQKIYELKYEDLIKDLENQEAAKPNEEENKPQEEAKKEEVKPEEAKK